MNTVETENWIFNLPEGWQQIVKENSEQIYFENKEETNGIYISTYRLKNGLEYDSKKIESHLEIEKANLKEMIDYKWYITEHVTLNGFTINSIDKSKNYRICIKHRFLKNVLSRFTFHDYDFDENNTNNVLINKIIGSFRLKEKSL